MKRKKKSDELVAVKLTKLVGKNVNGVMAQVVSPKYLVQPGQDSEGWKVLPKWRKLVQVTAYKQKGVKWVEMRWEREMGDTCSFSGCTVESNVCEVQFKKEDAKKLKLK